MNQLVKYIAADDAKCKSPCSSDCYRKRPIHPNTIQQVWIEPAILIDGDCMIFLEENQR